MMDSLTYNSRHAPIELLCQSTGQRIHPATPTGAGWVRLHQQSLDLTEDGMLGPTTQAALASRYGPLTTEQHTAHLQPWWVSRWGYDHAHDPGHLTWPYADPHWERQTGGGLWRDGMLRLVSGWDPRSRTFHRSPRSVVSLDTVSVGIAHHWAGTIPSHVGELIDAGVDVPEGWTVSHLRQLLGRRTGKGPARFELAAFVVGWRHLMEQDTAVRAHADTWLRRYVGKGRALVREFWGSRVLDSPDGGRILAACTRLANSGHAKKRIRVGLRKHQRPMPALESAYLTPRVDGGYGKPVRWQRIGSWPEFQGRAP